MAANQIIEKLFLNRELNDCLRKLVPQRFRDDFKQELFLILLEKEESVIKADSEGRLLFYAVRVILHMTNREGILNRLYKKKESVELKQDPQYCEESYPFEIRKFKEDREDRVIEKINSMENEEDKRYYHLLALALEEHGSAGKVAKATGIPKSSIQVGIKKLRKILDE